MGKILSSAADSKFPRQMKKQNMKKQSEANVTLFVQDRPSP